MPHRLLVIEHESLSPELSVAAMLGQKQDLLCERATWQSFVPERTRGAHLLVAVGIPDPSPAIAFFLSLERKPIAVPIVAILPERIDARETREVSRAADDFMMWPLRQEELEFRIARLLEARREQAEAPCRALAQEAAFAQLVGASGPFVDVVAKLPSIAASGAPVLLMGESGTGKELFAQAIHHLSERRGGPFVPVECGAIPENLMENELFGHARGAFTDAHADSRGLAALAEGGTLFLDEIDALPPSAQAKLLRFIQEGTYRALGSEKLVRSQVRIIAASNRDLETEVRERRFRLDLYFRLNVLNLYLPPLRERCGDIALLAHHFLHQACASSKSGQRSFSPAALRKLESHSWPGNVRELFAAVQRALVFCDGAHIFPHHITLHTSPSRAAVPRAENFRAARARALAEFEREYVQTLLDKHNGNVTHAAREAGKDRRAFGRLVKKHVLGGAPRAD